MEVKIAVAPEHTPPRAVIYTDRLTQEIQCALDILQAIGFGGTPIPTLTMRNFWTETGIRLLSCRREI